MKTLQAENVIKDCEKDKEVSMFSLSSLTSRKRKTKPTTLDLNLKAILASKKSLVTEIKSATVKSWSKDYSNSTENTLRSLNVYYSHNVMGKRKYNNIRKANNASSYLGVKVPNYIPYRNLSDEINSVDIEAVNDVNKLLPDSETKH